VNLKFTPFDKRLPEHQRFSDDRLTQRDIGLTAMFMARQGIMEKITAANPRIDISGLALKELVWCSNFSPFSSSGSQE
jgi:hypothetical protein